MIDVEILFSDEKYRFQNSKPIVGGCTSIFWQEMKIQFFPHQSYKAFFHRGTFTNTIIVKIVFTFHPKVTENK